MSTTAYYDIDTGATPITGTTATTVLAAPPPDITDTDVADEWQITHLSMYLNHTGDSQAFQFDLLANGTVIHRTLFSSIGSSTELRALRVQYDLIPTASTLALVFCDATLSGSGEIGPNARQRSTVPVPPEQPFDISDLATTPMVLDLRVTLGVDHASHVLSPVRTRIHKVEPVLSAGAGGGGDVISVNGQNGVVLLDAADVGAVPEGFQGMPTLQYDSGTTSYPSRPATPDPDDPVLYTGPVDPSAAGADFTAGVDFWWQTT